MKKYIDWQNEDSEEQLSESEFQEKLIQMFVENNRGKFDEIVAAIDIGDISHAYRLAHNLKSNAGQLNKPFLQKAAAEVELNLKNDKNLVSPWQMEALEAELNNAIADFKMLIDSPAATIAAEPVEPIVAPQITEEKKNSLLIVDDDVSNLMELSHILLPKYKIYTAKDGAQALMQAQKTLPDLILLDIVMPDMNGFDVLTELLKLDETKNIPVIFITGMSDDFNEHRGLELGAVDYIRKPFDMMVVKHRVRRNIKIINLQRDLESAAKAAESANQAKSSFLANMSHEIRTPMNAIIGITMILMQNEKLPHEIKEGLDKIYSSCDMLLGIINDILDFSKIEAGKMDITPSQYEIASMINDSVQLNIMRIGGKPIEFELQINENVSAKLIGDELRIKQILNNMLSNAFKYTEAGKVILSVTSEVSPDKQNVILCISVQDTGHGMSEEQLSKLFDEYTRFNQQSGRIVEGTGLGLAIMQQLVKMMGGEIHVESKPGTGSLFVIRLPQMVVSPEVIGKEKAENLKRFRINQMSKKMSQIIREPMPYGSVLIVDDVEANLYVAKGLLKPYKLQIDTASSGLEAVNRVKNGKVYDIIFMDHMMPVMDGIEAAKQLRELGYKPPIVALTANAVAGQADMFIQNGFDDFISKPIDIRQLNAVLNQLVRDKYLPGKSKAVQMQDIGEPESRIENIEIAGLDMIKGVMKYDEEDSYLQILDIYVKSIRSILKGIDIVNEDNLDAYKLSIHSIKGASLDVYADEIGNMAGDLENAANSGNLGYINCRTPEFLQKAWRIVNEIETMLLNITE
ncbi:MAG: response regulator [Lachnospiraceae bacterium]|nr:response regulator [Lachnospiraceae bacterium]